ncbi:RNA polymerase sigma-70 factor [Parabacteroides sp. W1-Q-101]|uniref:RNA polymerase sigma factor n=1 Tax=Parabacteroides TaxID=375288 RepID=UPI00202E282E|nr:MULTISPECIES: RNA polymerase sigma-70 factor [Parabacteroides]MCM0722100.1 RNA polymerase sigma-70 factor [Parabacteroides sp. W1-Q-101]
MNCTLLYRLKEGNKDAFNTIYWQYSPKVYNTILYLLNDSALAEDVVQELFLTIWEKRENIQPELNFEAYISTIARNLAYKAIEEAMQKNQMVEDLKNTKQIFTSEEDRIEADSLKEYIFNIISSFPEMRRKVFIMSRFENYSYTEIAEKLSLSERTVEAHIYQALKDLRKVLGNKAVAFILIYLSL